MTVVDFSGRHRSGSVSKAAMALVGAVGAVGIGGAAYVLWQIRPKDPSFEVIHIELSGFKVRWMTESLIPYAVVDVAMKISIKVTNPNITPIKYTSTTMVMFYRGTKMGTADVEAGSQDARSDQVIEIPAKLDGLKITEHLKELFQDVRKREMVMSAVVTITGDAIVWKIRHNWEVLL
uniref:Water stress and hypersensitive response domain-containing protein n=1 Tax=Physcomitrium patens TaxID=3218 RepID=A0A7I4C3I2_PHYPA